MKLYLSPTVSEPKNRTAIRTHCTFCLLHVFIHKGYNFLLLCCTVLYWAALAPLLFIYLFSLWSVVCTVVLLLFKTKHNKL